VQKILALESLRGLAALLVVFSHLGFAFYPAMMMGGANAPVHAKFESIIMSTPLNAIVNGHFAVIIFFILSGFVLSYGYFTRSIDLVSAAVKRYFRLVPIVFASVMLSYFLLKLHLYRNDELNLVTHSSWLMMFWQQDTGILDALWQGLVGTFALQPDPASLNPVLWTIYFELIGSLLVYAILGFVGKDSRRWIIYAIFTLTFIGTFYVGFIIGMALCDFFVHKPHIFQKIGHLPKGYKLGGLVAALTLASYPAYAPAISDLGLLHASLTVMPSPEINRNILYAVAGVIIVLLILTSNKIKSVFEFKPFVALGGLSYSLYATHLLILGSFGASIFLAFKAILPYNLAALATIPCFLIIALVVAYLFKRYIDTPSIKLSSSLIKQFGLSNRSGRSDAVEKLL
jgi:peptidoglycan/LPS O-acetylase OafA/YrhL